MTVGDSSGSPNHEEQQQQEQRQQQPSGSKPAWSSPVYKLGPADFILLSLLAFVLLYILPRKVLSIVRRGRVGGQTHQS